LEFFAIVDSPESESVVYVSLAGSPTSCCETVRS
jgi:hypothetical protein